MIVCVILMFEDSFTENELFFVNVLCRPSCLAWLSCGRECDEDQLLKGFWRRKCGSSLNLGLNEHLCRKSLTGWCQTYWKFWLCAATDRVSRTSFSILDGKIKWLGDIVSSWNKRQLMWQSGYLSEEKLDGVFGGSGTETLLLLFSLNVSCSMMWHYKCD